MEHTFIVLPPAEQGNFLAGLHFPNVLLIFSSD
jgi:hypothetical protein